MRTKQLTLIFDGFKEWNNTVPSSNDWKYLRIMLSRAKTESLKAENPLVTMINLLNCPSLDMNALPIAALELYAEEKISTDQWVCRADPVNILPHREHLSIADADYDDIDFQELLDLTEELNVYFKEYSIKFLASETLKCYCFSQEPFAVSEKTARAIINENLLHHIPQASENNLWKKYFNEVQIFLHHSKTLHVRMSKGKHPINSLWLWGGGKLPVPYHSTIKNLMTNDPVVFSLAKLGRVNTKSCQSSEQLLKSLTQEEQIVYFDLNKTILDSSGIKIDDQLFEILWNKINNNELLSLTIIINKQQKYLINKASNKKFWKSGKRLEDLI